jgi:hypothetical protein
MKSHNNYKKRELLDPTFKLEEKYFYHKLTEDEWSNLTTNIKKYFEDSSTQAKSILSNNNLHKGGDNIKKLKQLYILLISESMIFSPPLKSTMKPSLAINN